MKNPSLFLVLLALAFVGTTSCGDNTKDAEIAALRQQLALQASGQGRTTVVITNSQTVAVTSYVLSTTTQVTSSTVTSGSSYTVTATGTASSTSTSSAYRM